MNMSSLGEGRAFDVSCDLHLFRNDMGGRNPDDSLKDLNCSFGNAQSWKPSKLPRCNGDTSQVAAHLARVEEIRLGKRCMELLRSTSQQSLSSQSKVVQAVPSNATKRI